MYKNNLLNMEGNKDFIDYCGNLEAKEQQLIYIKNKYTKEELNYAYRMIKGWYNTPDQDAKALEVLEDSSWEVISAIEFPTMLEYFKFDYEIMNNDCNCYNECHPCDCDERRREEQEEN